MTLLLAVVAGALVGAASWLALRDLFAGPLFARENHRGATVATAAGLVLVVTSVALEAVWAVLWTLGLGGGPSADRLLVVLAVVGFGLLGLVDDLAGSGADGRGFRGHLRALARGRLTTGGLKLAGGAALAVVLCAPRSRGSVGQLVVDSLLVALAANLCNLFDRAPGRTVKVGVVAAVALFAAAGFGPHLAAVGVVVGAALGVLRDDLGERLMLGDTGANALGAALGLGVVLSFGPLARVVVLVVVAALNVASEVVSFSAVIDRVAVLRTLDRLGRRP